MMYVAGVVTFSCGITCLVLRSSRWPWELSITHLIELEFQKNECV